MIDEFCLVYKFDENMFDFLRKKKLVKFYFLAKKKKKKVNFNKKNS